MAAAGRMPIREATLEDTPAIVRLAARFLATTAYGRILNISLEQLEALVPIVLERGVIFVGEHVTLGPFDQALPVWTETSVEMIGPKATIVGFLAAIEATDSY